MKIIHAIFVSIFILASCADDVEISECRNVNQSYFFPHQADRKTVDEYMNEFFKKYGDLKTLINSGEINIEQMLSRDVSVKYGHHILMGLMLFNPSYKNRIFKKMIDFGFDPWLKAVDEQVPIANILVNEEYDLMNIILSDTQYTVLQYGELMDFSKCFIDVQPYEFMKSNYATLTFTVAQ